MFTEHIGATTEWVLKNPACKDVEVLAARLKISPILARILVTRGIVDPEAGYRFLHPAAQALLDPMLLRDMTAAVKRVRRALAARERILAYGDYDVDGTFSLAILKRSLELLGGAVEIHVPHRLYEGYGLRREVIEQSARKGVTLLITVDTGVRAHDVIEYAGSVGIDVVVTDHHLPDATLPPAVAVVNPNRSDCAYPNKHLCGAAVTFKLIQALLRHSSVAASRQEQILTSLLKPVSIATIADVVPLVGENRTLVAQGLAGLQNIRNPGLAALFATAGIASQQVPSSQQIAFQIAPRINAAGRMESAQAVIDLLLTEDPCRAKELALQLNRWNGNRRQLERAMVNDIIGSREHHAEASGYVFWVPGAHLGVVGIVASRLVEKLSAPVIVLTDDPKDRGVLAGSGRSIPGFHLLEALESMADLFLSFGGHSQAAGLRLRYAQFDEFESRFHDYAAQRSELVQNSHSRFADAEVRFSDIALDLARELQSIEPFGCGNPVPVFLARGVRLAGAIRTLTPGKHFVIPLAQEQRRITAKAWNFSGYIPLIESGTPIDVLLNIDEE